MSDATGLLADKERAGVIRTVLSNNPGMAEDTAARIVNEAIKFTATCAKFPEARLRPSRVVDEGWHALILHTRVYKDLCDGLGRFVHHTPQPPDPSRHNSGELTRTQEMIVKAGFPVDDALWLAPGDESIPVAATCEHSEPGGEGTCTGDCSNTGPN
ncbi:glycine-rich domain-containing protein [Streptomyces sparsogenes]|uniref:glycine-rich domain-containing protein n=1 Tax=Streptomyces sparsogenes TaxID=67365 RepID=UPI0033E52191